jgi:cytochrome c
MYSRFVKHLLQLSCFVAAAALAAPALAVTELDPIGPRLATADPERGATVALQCKACHAVEKGAAPIVGPTLWGIVERPVASHEGFDYTDSLKGIGGSWGYEKLSRYLFDPQAVAPGTRMAYTGLKPAQDRADLIAYLRSLADEPVALPSVPEGVEGPRYGGLPDGAGREAVYFTCRACHALDQFTGESLPREEWDALLTEMVADNGMAAPEPWARSLMLDYLAAHFGEKQDWQGLPPGKGREEVFYTCNACHSLMLVTQQGMNRDRWDETLEWMVEEQGMNEIEDVAMRDRILDYLSTHFGSSG